jgi:hypothetical protein
MWSPWRYAKETGRMGENVKKDALNKLSRRRAALRIDNSKSEILHTAQNANAAFKRGLDDIHNHRYSEGVNKLTSATDQLEKDTYANAAHATTDFNKGIAGLDSKLRKANNVFGNSMIFENGSEADSAAVDEIIRKAADDVAKENARRLPPASKRGSRKSK